MSQKTPTTEFARQALDELFQLIFVCGQIVNDIKGDESVIQKRNDKWPDLPPVTNKPFNSAASRAIGILLICRAVDIYNWYCRETFKLALSVNPKLVVSVIRKQEGAVAKAIAKADKQGVDAASKVISEFLSDRYRGDRVIRETIHRNLDVMQNPEVELLCTCRNVLVHKRGHDEFGEIAEGIRTLGPSRAFIGASRYPPDYMPISVDAEQRLVVDERIGDWAAELLQQQIFMMDQNFAHVYKLPRKVREPASIGRKWLAPSER